MSITSEEQVLLRLPIIMKYSYRYNTKIITDLHIFIFLTYMVDTYVVGTQVGK